MQLKKSINWSRHQLEQDLAELEELLRRAHHESNGSEDDELARRLLSQLIERRRDQIRRLSDPLTKH